MLPAPNLKLLAAYEEHVRSLPTPDYVLKNGDFFHGSSPYYYKWCPVSQHWIDACSDLPLDRLRHPIPRISVFLKFCLPFFLILLLLFSLPPATINITNKLSYNENYCAINTFILLKIIEL